MDENNVVKLECPHCNSIIKKDDDFCPDCGTLFAEFVKCIEHKDKEAEGVCVICCNPFCAECGIYVNEIFLCNEHSEYETAEGMACVLSSDDSMQMGFAKTSLETNELHPVIFSNGAHSIYQTGAYYGSGGNNGYPNSEIYLMVPFQEVIRAEEILDELNMLE